MSEDIEYGKEKKGVYGYLPDGREVAIASIVWSDERIDWYSYVEGRERKSITKQEADRLIAGEAP